MKTGNDKQDKPYFNTFFIKTVRIVQQKKTNHKIQQITSFVFFFTVRSTESVGFVIEKQKDFLSNYTFFIVIWGGSYVVFSF
jgi:hypothetical protein